MVNGKTSKNEDKVELEKKLLISEIKRNESEAEKLKREAKWYSRRLIIHYTLAVLISGALVAAYILTYLQPILNQKNETAKLENQALKYTNQIRQAQLEQKDRFLSEENKKIKNDYTELISQNKILEKEQQKVRASSEKLRKELENAKDMYSELSKKYDISSKEKEKYAKLVKKSDESINSLKKEIKLLKIAQEKTAFRAITFEAAFESFMEKSAVPVEKVKE